MPIAGSMDSFAASSIPWVISAPRVPSAGSLRSGGGRRAFGWLSPLTSADQKGRLRQLRYNAAHREERLAAWRKYNAEHAEDRKAWAERNRERLREQNRIRMRRLRAKRKEQA